MSVASEKGIIEISSPYSFEESLKRIEEKIREKGLTVFCVVDHSGAAEKAGLQMPPTKVLLFGNPHGGTPVMVASPTSAIDLPLKVLLWEDAGGRVCASYNSPEYLKERHNIPETLVPRISAVGPLLQAALA
ncbi:MAG TPA: DUF302 domain-containing protein [Candidatus Saccharimonadales bacterium]|jgi:uncharacterized protein (DUF302 family)|nr:DUF302 domain-containing protein [Candidatus Saccharimonadales bacterium]